MHHEDIEIIRKIDMKKKILVCSLKEFEEEVRQNKFFAKWSDELKDEIVIYQYQNNLLAYSGVCPHFGGPLRPLPNGDVRCGWHDWRFSASEGHCINRKIKCRLVRYELEIDEHEIKVIK